MGSRDPSAPAPRAVVLGLLGGIGSGKSAVARILAGHGARVLDADRMVAEALTTAEVVEELRRRLGAGVVPEGRVDRAALARRVFGDPAALAALEEVLHPPVRARIEAELERLLARPDVPAVVLDVPLLLERSSLEQRCDLFIFVDCPADIRRDRVATLRSWPRGELERREARQWPLERKRAAADAVLDNSGTEAELAHRVASWLQEAGGFAALPRRGDRRRHAEPADERPDGS